LRTDASNFNAPASVVSVSVLIDSIGTACFTGARPSRTSPITRCVGESGVSSSGCAASKACSSVNSLSYSTSGISGVSST
jgi:hypothetical protein